MTTMNKFRILAATLIAMLAATAWCQDDYVNDETVPDNDETLAEVIDSKQYNKWTSSKNFVLGVQSMTHEIDDVATDDAEVDEAEPYKSAIALFKKELKQHPRNAYAKCNIAICETHIASINLNKTLVDIFNGEDVIKIPLGTSDEEKMALLEAFYQEKLKEKESAVNNALKLLDEGIAMLPAADKQSRCKALLAKSEILKDNDFDDAVQEACLIEATKVHPCDESYLNLLYFYSERNIMRRRRERGANLKPRFYSTPWTIAKVSTDIIRRPNYYKMHIASGEWTYRWQPSETSRHEFSPLTLKYQFMNSHTDEFEDIISKNPYIIVSMSDFFIPKMRYTYTYTSPQSKVNPIRWETSLEESGNVTALYDVVVQGNGWNQRDKTLFKNVYSQFLRFETDLTKTWNLDSKSQLVGHVNAGFIYNYGNTTEPPYSEAFYAGGANSIRAFTVRSIGPGAFPGLSFSKQFSYVLHNGDIKLVMNLEYRRQLVGSLYGAVYLDAGNVWNRETITLDKADYEEDYYDTVDFMNSLYANSTLRPSTFLKQLATGTGIGLRYDLEFLVVRVDWGFGLHLPYDTGKSGYFNISGHRLPVLMLINVER